MRLHVACPELQLCAGLEVMVSLDGSRLAHPRRGCVPLAVVISSRRSFWKHLWLQPLPEGTLLVVGKVSSSSFPLRFGEGPRSLRHSGAAPAGQGGSRGLSPILPSASSLPLSRAEKPGFEVGCGAASSLAVISRLLLSSRFRLQPLPLSFQSAELLWFVIQSWKCGY